MTPPKQTMDEKLDDILEIVREIHNNAVHKTDFNNFKNEADYRLGNIESQLVKVEDRMGQLEVKVEGIKAGVEKTADILEQKQIITEPEKKIIYNTSSPFAVIA